MPYKTKCYKHEGEVHPETCVCKGTGEVEIVTEQEREDEKRAYYVERGALSCIVCGLDIDEDRVKRKAVTCSDECRKTAEAIRRAKRCDNKRCRLCGRPATDQDKERWKAFRKWERETYPDTTKPLGRPKGSKNKPPEDDAGTKKSQHIEHGLPSAADLDAVAEEELIKEKTFANYE